MKITKLKSAIALGVISALALPGAAAAHVSVTPDEAPAEGYVMLEFVVPHGCDGAATNQVSVKMPPQVVTATPEVVPGWEIKTKEGKLPKPVTQEGETVSEGVREVTWSGGPLPDGQLQQFGMSVSLAGEVGDAAEFKVIQGCEGGKETAWIQPTPASGEEPEHPVPTVTLGEAEAGHGHGAEAEGKDVEQASADSVSDDDGSSDGLAIAALIVGALGLLVGGTALVTARRSGK